MAAEQNVMDSLKGKRILLGVTGSIAAYKACELVRLLRQEGAEVTVAMTRAATSFVGPTTFAALTGRPVVLEQFPADPNAGLLHVELAETLDAVVVAPATANILGKAAHAIADDFISTTLNIVDCPVLFAPAMNHRMWRNPATRAAVAQLRAGGRRVLDPDTGLLASLHEGVGRLPAVSRILSELREILAIPQLYRGKRVLITAGPTREPIDPVRYISNRSSGKMGYALAAAARDYGAQVTLISGPVALDPVPGCRMEAVTTAEDLQAAVLREIQEHDVLFMAAAVADFAVARPAQVKLRRKQKPAALPLVATADILQSVRPKFRGVLVAFALQGQESVHRAAEKLAAARADFVVLNRYDVPGAGPESDSNHVWLLSSSGHQVELPAAPKAAVAREILKRVAL